MRKYFFVTEEDLTQGNELDTSLSQNQIQLSCQLWCIPKAQQGIFITSFLCPSKSRIRNLQS